MLAAVFLDDSLWEKVPEARRQEWRLAIRELVDDHVFSVEASPLVLRLGFGNDEVTLRWEIPGERTVADVHIGLSVLTPHLEQYVRVCKEMMALPIDAAAAVKLPALDKSKKEAHDAAADLLQTLNDAVRPSHDTSRRLFTLLVTLLVDTTSLSVLRRPHQDALARVRGDPGAGPWQQFAPPPMAHDANAPPVASVEPAKPGLPVIDVNEYGGKRDGVRQELDRRLYLQLLVFDAPAGVSSDRMAASLGTLLRDRGIPGVVYADTNDPRGVGLLTWAEDPAHFVSAVRPLFAADFLEQVSFRNDFAMLGRTYSTGHEPDLEFVLLRRPIENVLKASYGWHIWYPLRRSGAFAKLEGIDQSHILREHASIGMAYGQKDLAHDIRLACHGLDARDNEFVIGIVGERLHPLSHLVQTMRKTRQTSEFISQMGPFFVGRVVERSGT